MLMIKSWIYCCLLTLPPILGLSQNLKQEVEKRIKAEEMPAIALEILATHLSQASKIRYYKETDIGHQSFECKFILDRLWYSVEFDENGAIEDVEIKMDFEQIPQAALDKIRYSLSAYDRYRIRRTQRQYTLAFLSSDDLLTMVIKGADELELRYEIVLSVKKDGSWTTYEMLFDQSGLLIEKKEVVDRQTDNILYQ